MEILLRAMNKRDDSQLKQELLSKGIYQELTIKYGLWWQPFRELIVILFYIFVRKKKYKSWYSNNFLCKHSIFFNKFSDIV